MHIAGLIFVVPVHKELLQFCVVLLDIYNIVIKLSKHIFSQVLLQFSIACLSVLAFFYTVFLKKTVLELLVYINCSKCHLCCC